MLGPVADRFGLRRTLLVAQAMLAPMILVFVARRRRSSARSR